MSQVAIIPARGGSKRLLRKNVVDFHGRPIIAWSIDAAVHSGCFERVIVSTEDEAIASAARAAGAEVAVRDAALAGDEIGVVAVCADLLQRLASAGEGCDRFACLYATAPLREAADVRAVVDLVVPGEAEFALAVTDYSHPPHQALRCGANASVTPMWPGLVNRRSDAIGELVVDNGSTYAAVVSAFLHHRSFYGPGLRAYRMPARRSVDIDGAEQLALARWYAGQRSACVS